MHEEGTDEPYFHCSDTEQDNHRHLECEFLENGHYFQYREEYQPSKNFHEPLNRAFTSMYPSRERVFVMMFVVFVSGFLFVTHFYLNTDRRMGIRIPKLCPHSASIDRIVRSCRDISRCNLPCWPWQSDIPMPEAQRKRALHGSLW